MHGIQKNTLTAALNVIQCHTHRNMHTDLNSKDQDSLANCMAEMRREAKEREIEREVEGFRESLHQAKTNLLHLCDSHGQMPIQYPCPKNTPGIPGTHGKQIPFPLAFFKCTIPFFLSCGQYC